MDRTNTAAFWENPLTVLVRLEKLQLLRSNEDDVDAERRENVEMLKNRRSGEKQWGISTVEKFSFWTWEKLLQIPWILGNLIKMFRGQLST